MNPLSLESYLKQCVTNEINRIGVTDGLHEEHMEHQVENIANHIKSSPEFDSAVRALVQRRVHEVNHEVQMMINGGKSHQSDEPIRLINLTPHPVTIFDQNGEVAAEIPMGDTCVRVQNAGMFLFERDIQTEDGQVFKNIPFSYFQRNAKLDLPEPKPGVYYVVSALVTEIFPYREDLIAINTSNDKIFGCVRDTKGHIQGTRSLRPSTAGALSGLVG